MRFRSFGSYRLSVCATIALVFLIGLPAIAAAIDDLPPIKLNIQSNNQVFEKGQTASIQITLFDAENRPSRATEDLAIQLNVVSPEGKARQRSTRIETHTRSVNETIILDQTGIYEISAQSDQLLDDGLLIKVLETRREIKDGLDLDSLMEGRLESGSGLSGSDFLPATRFEIDLRVFPDEPRIADGKDSARIFAYLVGQNTVAPAEIQIILHSNDGHLDPNVLKIEKGNFRGRTNLTSEHIGSVEIEFMGAQPNVRMRGDKKLQVDFNPPVTRLELITSPQKISLFEKTKIIVRLLDHAGNLIADNRIRNVYLSLANGKGHFSRNNIEIPPNQGQADVEFYPILPNDVVIEAHSPNLLKQRTQIIVGWPVLLLILTGIGATVGGLLSHLLKEDSNRWLILGGPVFGLVLYWAMLFGLIDILPDYLLLNPISAFVIAVIGGWSGPKILDSVLKRVNG